MNTHKWTADQLPDQTGRVAVVTGGNSGLGFETVQALAAKNARVILAVRSNEKGAAAVHRILKAHPRSQVEMRMLDLASLDSIRRFAESFQQDFDRLDYLINNAGVMAIPRRETADGFEMQFGVNHLGHFALTGLMFEHLLATPHSRVVTVSSMLHQSGRINFDDLMGAKTYSKQGAYAQSKLANLLFAYELQRRLNSIEDPMLSVAAHPGYAATNLQTAGPEMEGATINKYIMELANTLIAQSAAMGALPILYAAAAPGVTDGKFYGPDGFMGMRGYPVEVQSSPASHDLETARQLWQVSEALTGVAYPVLTAIGGRELAAA